MLNLVATRWEVHKCASDGRDMMCDITLQNASTRQREIGEHEAAGGPHNAATADVKSARAMAAA